MPIRKVQYCYVVVPNRAGKGAEVLGKLRQARVNLYGYSGFPSRGGNAQLDLVAGSVTPIRKLSKQNGWRVSKVKKGFLIQGKDRVGAIHQHLRKLAARNINITAADAVTAGRGRFGMLLWVKQKDYGRAARVLKAR